MVQLWKRSTNQEDDCVFKSLSPAERLASKYAQKLASLGHTDNAFERTVWRNDKTILVPIWQISTNLLSFLFLFLSRSGIDGWDWKSNNVVTYPFLQRGSAVWGPHARHPDQNDKDTLAKQRCYNNNKSTNVVTYPFLERGSAVWVPHARHPDQNVKDTLAKQKRYNNNNNNKQFTRKNNRIALLRAEEPRGTENPTGKIDSVLQYASQLRLSPLLSQNLQANGVESVIVPRNEWRHWHDHSWTGMIWSQVNPFLF